MDDVETGFALTVHAVGPADAMAVCRLLHTCLGDLVTALEQDPDGPLSEIELFDKAERDRLVQSRNDTALDVPQESAPRMFEAQAARTPDAVALAYAGELVTYAELDARADLLARHLLDLGVGAESVVGVRLPRGIDMITTVLAVWKAGAAYLPLDPAYPARLDYMLADSGARLVIVRGGTAPETSAIPLLNLDDLQAAPTPDRSPRIDVSPTQLAYVIYVGFHRTAEGRGGVACRAGGPGGRPGGTVRPRRRQPDAAVRVDELRRVRDRGAGDAGVRGAAGPGRLLGTAAGRGTGRGRGTARRDAREAAARRAGDARTTGPGTGDITDVGGEALSAEQVARWAPGRRFVNVYGPTETTVCAAMSAPLNPGDEPDIGGPIANTRVFVLDERLRPVPDGVTGELYVAGPGGARLPRLGRA